MALESGAAEPVHAALYEIYDQNDLLRGTSDNKAPEQNSELFVRSACRTVQISLFFFMQRNKPAPFDPVMKMLRYGNGSDSRKEHPLSFLKCAGCCKCQLLSCE